MPKLLVIDDDPLTHRVIRRFVAGTNIRVVCSNSATRGLHVLRQQRPDVVMLNLLMPDAAGNETLKAIQARCPHVPVIFMTAGDASDQAIEAMRLGAFDYLLKPLERDKVRSLVQRAINAGTTVAATDDGPSQGVASDSLVGRSAKMHDVYKAIGTIAAQDVTVLIRGESGTGKQRVARAIHRFSPRVARPLLTVDCQALPAILLENELFGIEDRSTGAAPAIRQGKCEQCFQGTLLLNEVGDIEPPTQGKLLRLLREQRFERVGGDETVDSQVRVIATTSRNLEQLVATGQFRQDLYYQLNVFAIDLPPLRERRGDIALLAEHFLGQFNRELEKDVHGIAPEAMQMLLDYHWPGNVRELESVLKQSALRATAPVLTSEVFPSTLKPDPPAPPVFGPRASADWQQFIRTRMEEGTDSLYAQALQHMETQLLSEVLQFTQGNKVQAAKILGMTRGTLRGKLSSLGITVAHVVGREES